MRLVVIISIVGGIAAVVAKVVAAYGQCQDETENPQSLVVPEDMPRTLENFCNI